MESIITRFLSADFLAWFTSSGLRIVGIIVGVFIFNKIVQLFLERLIRKIIISDRYSSKEAEKKREDTLIKIVNSTISVIVISIAGIMILQSFGIPTAPILAAVGIIGVAVGFGGQYLISDVISGLFIILENQYRVGDIVSVGGVSGLVEDISLRMTTLRDLDGTVHHISHGQIKTLSNLSKTYSRINLNIGVAYDSDLEKVKTIINKIGNDLAQDPLWKDSILKAPQFLRVNNFGDSSIDIKILGETNPGKQWEITGELRFRIKVAFDKEGIEIPFPQMVVHQGKN